MLSAHCSRALSQVLRESRDYWTQTLTSGNFCSPETLRKPDHEVSSLGGNDGWAASPSCFQRTRRPEFCLTLISQARKPLKKPHWFRDSLKGFVSTLIHTHVYPRVDSGSQLSPLNTRIRNHQRALRERCSLRNFASSWHCAYHKGGLHDCQLEG